MNQRNFWVALTAVTAFAVLVGWWLYTFEYAEREVDAPLHGEARYNPLYGLARTLRERGVKVDSRANLNLKAMALGDHDTLLLGADVRTLSREDVKQLLDWVDGGGHLIFSLPQGKEGRSGELLAALHLAVIPAGDCLRWQVEAEQKPAMHCFRFAFRIETGAAKNFDLLIRDGKQSYLLGRSAHGDGDWLVVGDLNFLRTAQLKQPGNAALAAQLFAPASTDGTVHLVYAADVAPLYVLLVRRGWPALAPLLLALLAWLWMRSQRFGPVLPIADANRRALLDHIRAAGDFIFRRGSAIAMYAALRRSFLARLRRDQPAIAALSDDAMVTALAAAYKRPPDEIRQALTPIGLGQPERFLAAVKTLHALGARQPR